MSRGAHLAVEAGCYACHGRGDGEKRFNLRQSGTSWTNKTNPTFWDAEITKVDRLVEWIANGVAADEVEKHKKLFIKMPAYKDRLTSDEIEAIAAFILAEGLKFTQGIGPTAKPVGKIAPNLSGDPLLVAGDRLSRKFGCYQCHGELGQGGVANPNSFKGYIPGFQGNDFLELTDHGNRAEILYWIDQGRGRAIESGPLGRIAKYFGDGQATQMPGYKDQLTPAEKELLVDYMLHLNRAGPLSAKEIERLILLLDNDA